MELIFLQVPSAEPFTILLRVFAALFFLGAILNGLGALRRNGPYSYVVRYLLGIASVAFLFRLYTILWEPVTGDVLPLRFTLNVSVMLDMALAVALALTLGVWKVGVEKNGDS